MLRSLLWVNISVMVIFFSSCSASFKASSLKGGQQILLDSSSKWRIEFNTNGFRQEIADTKINYYYFNNPNHGLNVSINFDQTQRCSSSETCCDFLIDQMGRKDKTFLDGLKRYHLDNFSVFEYIDQVGEQRKHERFNMNAHYFLDNLWVDIHLSKIGFEEKDRKHFDAFLRSVKIIPHKLK